MKRVYWIVPLMPIALLIAADVAGAQSGPLVPRAGGTMFTCQGPLKNNVAVVNSK